MRTLLFYILLILPQMVFSQKPVHSFKLSNERSNLSEVTSRPAGNFIGVITVHEDTVLIEAGGKLNITTDGGASWKVISTSDGIYKGSVQAINYFKSKIFVTTIFDTSLSIQPTYGGGGGISISKDFGQTWMRVPQPRDTSGMLGSITRTGPGGQPQTFLLAKDFMIRQTPFVTDTIYMVAVKSHIDNVSFDVAVTDTSIWLACFGGGLRFAKINPDGSIGFFTQAPLPPTQLDEVRADTSYSFDIDPIEHLNYRVFSVIAARDGIWAGSAGGINHSTDGGMSWKKYTATNSGISGNLVTAIGEQIYSEGGNTKRNIWASTNRALSESEEHGLSVTSDSGASWRVALRGPFVYNVAFDGKDVYAATSDGVYRSGDLGLTWEHFLILIDKNTGDRNYAYEFLSVGIDTVQDIIYFGSIDGLAISDDHGQTWTFARASQEAGKNGTPKSYAYPNPFSPGVEPNVVRFQFDQTGMNTATDKATIKVYDFAMDLVSTVAKNEPITKAFAWNGLNNKGMRVANGTYVYIIEAGGKKFWGKLTVRN
ncbi:hypothetical protein JNM05_10840 [bacterium]|nr:hypothetical protein [bacterium]